MYRSFAERLDMSYYRRIDWWLCIENDAVGEQHNAVLPQGLDLVGNKGGSGHHNLRSANQT
jgi:hypothetical protein